MSIPRREKLVVITLAAGVFVLLFIVGIVRDIHQDPYAWLWFAGSFAAALLILGLYWLLDWVKDSFFS